MMCGFGSREEESRGISSASSAIDILAKRYAGGEMGKEEYEAKERVIKQGN
jgi:uncharacterized membrane protein